MPIGALIYSLGMVAGLLGLWLVPGLALKRFVVPILAVFLAIYVAGNATSRFRVPLVPFVLMFSGPLVTGHRSRSCWRLAGATITLAWFFTVVAVDVLAPPRVPVHYADKQERLLPVQRASMPTATTFHEPMHDSGDSSTPLPRPQIAGLS
jgi:hypothetical protein